ncbi:MAG: hypothetical protein SFV23_09615, partial [Planctomycetaceae bacterium]|nr:hypothetical protein [Planctomycetaceae bacterium]
KIVESLAAFESARAGLLETNPRQFCAFHGSKKLGVGPDPDDLVRAGELLKIPASEIAIYWIDEFSPEDEIEVFETVQSEVESGRSTK